MSFVHRRENRTIEEFDRDINVWTAREKRWAEIFRAELEQRGKKVSAIIDYGADNTGKLTTAEHIKATPDKIFIINGKPHKIEIKSAYVQQDIDKIKFLTYKDESLRAIVKYDAFTLTTNRKWYMIMSPEVAQGLLDKYPRIIFAPFSPTKKVIQVPTQDIQ